MVMVRESPLTTAREMQRRLIDGLDGMAGGNVCYVW
jgi:hypothetical protein